MTEWDELNVLPDIDLMLVVSERGIRAIQFHPAQSREGWRNPENPLLRAAAKQLKEYFSGELQEFDLPLDMVGTDFQQKVWRALLTIPYGETRSYAQIASAIGLPKAVRAVGAANGANPVPIVVPCHRVIGSGGRLVGYGGGLRLKQRLLQLESRRHTADLFL